MVSFEYTVTDPVGIHARPAGALVRIAAAAPCEVTIAGKGKDVSMKKLFALMSLGIKGGDEVKVTCTGEGEEETLSKIEDFFRANL